MKRIIFTLVMALSATAMWAQSGVILSYTEGGAQKEQAFRLDSVSSWGYNPSDKTVFVQPLVGAKFSIPSQNFISFIYSPIVSDNVEEDYLVVHVDGQKAAFRFDEDFEMTWKDGVLAIKDKKQSQNIGLKNGIFFNVERRTFGYTNSAISATPAKGDWYLVLNGPMYSGLSFGSNHFCGYHVGNSIDDFFNILIGRIENGRYGSALFIYKFGYDLYISNKIIGDLFEVN